MQGYGVDFNSEYFGGPFDGHKSIVISLDGNLPPKVVFEKTNEIKTEKVELGRKLLEKWAERHIANDQQVAVYEIRGNSDDYEGDAIVPYTHAGTMSFLDFKKKYW